MEVKSAEPYVTRMGFPEFGGLAALRRRRAPASFDIELTARCNLNCRHCYINLPAGDEAAEKKELPLAELEKTAGEAVSLGSVWCLMSGGEPLLRRDFFDIYMMLKKKGLLLSLFTNATLIREEHVRFLRQYPPRDIEVTVYGVTKETYEGITRVPGSYQAFMSGLDMLLGSGIPVRLKAMALRSNKDELEAIAEFCRERTSDFFRFDPFLNLRLDRDAARNAEIIAERLSPEEIVALEMADQERSEALISHCGDLVFTGHNEPGCRHLFRCGAGLRRFLVGWDGNYRICLPLVQPEFLYDLRRGSLTEAWERFTPKVLSREAQAPEFFEKCAACSIINLCMWCPGQAWLETGDMERPVEYFCRTAEARAAAIKNIDKTS